MERKPPRSTRNQAPIHTCSYVGSSISRLSPNPFEGPKTGRRHLRQYLPGALGDRKVKHSHGVDVSVPESYYYTAPALGIYQFLGPLGMLLGLGVVMRE